MSIIRTRPKSKRWRKNWSGRGIALVNSIEKFIDKPRVTKHPSIKEQLKALSLKRPNCKFYRSLLEQMKDKPLSRKQINCISEEYVNLCTK